MSALIQAKNVNKQYGDHKALSNVNFEVSPGRIVGLIGPNGAGKTTLLKGILGLSPVDGELNVLGLNPSKDRTRLLEQVSFIADTAIMPKWIKVNQALDYVEGVHPRFNRQKARLFLDKTNIKAESLVSSLSKGMVTQLHLAIVMAIDSQLLVLDEPTLGLDIVYRKQFYNTLLNDYFDEQKTILVTTHQVEEIANILTDLIFINHGEIVLDKSIESIENDFSEIHVTPDIQNQILNSGLQPIYQQKTMGSIAMIFENTDKEKLATFGKISTPSISDLFVAKMGSQEGGE